MVSRERQRSLPLAAKRIPGLPTHSSFFFSSFFSSAVS
jgi:hypothetical protein